MSGIRLTWQGARRLVWVGSLTLAIVGAIFSGIVSVGRSFGYPRGWPWERLAVVEDAQARMVNLPERVDSLAATVDTLTVAIHMVNEAIRTASAERVDLATQQDDALYLLCGLARLQANFPVLPPGCVRVEARMRTGRR